MHQNNAGLGRLSHLNMWPKYELFPRGGEGLDQTKSFEATYFSVKASLSKKCDLTIGLVKNVT